MRVAALALLGAFGMAAALVVPAKAAPVVPAMPAPGVSDIIQVAQACGHRFHRNHRGLCVPNRSYRPYAYHRRYRPYGYYYGGGNEFLNRPSPSDHVANWLNGEQARHNWGYGGY